MPQYDGTGPNGQGPSAGRGRGYCHSARNVFRLGKPSGKALLPLALAVVGMIAKDAMNPDGIARKLFRRLADHFSHRVGKPKQDFIKEIRTVEAEILPNEHKR